MATIRSIEESAELLHMSERAILGGIENGELHFVDTPEDKLLICGNSI